MDIFRIEGINEFITHYPNNAGQRKEEKLRYYLTGQYHKADNIPHDIKTDIDIYQIKSSHATIATDGKTVKEYIQIDKAEKFIYIMNDELTCIVMSREEWITFTDKFTDLTDTYRNGVTRLKRENDEFKKYFAKLIRTLKK